MSYQTESDRNSIGMRLQPFAVGKCGNYRSECLEAVSCQFLRRDVFLEGQGVYAAELACVAVRRQCVVCAGCVIAATIMGRAAGQEGGDDYQRCAGEQERLASPGRTAPRIRFLRSAHAQRHPQPSRCAG